MQRRLSVLSAGFPPCGGRSASCSGCSGGRRAAPGHGVKARAAVCEFIGGGLLTEDTGVPLDQLQAEQISLFRRAWAEAGHAYEPRVSVSRSVLPIADEEDRHSFGLSALRGGRDQEGVIDGLVARFGKSYVGEPEALAGALAADAAAQAADTLLLTVPNQLGVDFNAKLLGTVVRHLARLLAGRHGATAPRRHGATATPDR
ncbi:hypothetical protein BJG92_01200 [Arthrobacter sp. SO5]|nr:hypothetical protein [Arthrobacter sp. SO5]